MDKSTTVGGDNRHSMLTTGGTDAKNIQDKKWTTKVNKSALSQMRNS